MLGDSEANRSIREGTRRSKVGDGEEKGANWDMKGGRESVCKGVSFVEIVTVLLSPIPSLLGLKDLGGLRVGGVRANKAKSKIRALRPPEGHAGSPVSG